MPPCWTRKHQQQFTIPYPTHRFSERFSTGHAKEGGLDPLVPWPHSTVREWDMTQSLYECCCVVVFPTNSHQRFPVPFSSVFLVVCRWIEKQKNQHFHDLKIPFFTRMTKHGVYNCSRGRGDAHVTLAMHAMADPFWLQSFWRCFLFIIIFFFCAFRPTRSQWGSTTQLFLYFVQTTQSYFWFWASKKMLRKEENQISYPSTDE